MTGTEDAEDDSWQTVPATTGPGKAWLTRTEAREFAMVTKTIRTRNTVIDLCISLMGSMFATIHPAYTAGRRIRITAGNGK